MTDKQHRLPARADYDEQVLAEVRRLRKKAVDARANADAAQAEFADCVVEAMERHRISGTELAREAGVSSQWLYDMRRRRKVGQGD